MDGKAHGLGIFSLGGFVPCFGILKRVESIDTHDVFAVVAGYENDYICEMTKRIHCKTPIGWGLWVGYRMIPAVRATSGFMV